MFLDQHFQQVEAAGNLTSQVGSLQECILGSGHKGARELVVSRIWILSPPIYQTFHSHFKGRERIIRTSVQTILINTKFPKRPPFQTSRLLPNPVKIKIKPYGIFVLF